MGLIIGLILVTLVLIWIRLHSNNILFEILIAFSSASTVITSIIILVYFLDNITVEKIQIPVYYDYITTLNKKPNISSEERLNVVKTSLEYNAIIKTNHYLSNNKFVYFMLRGFISKELGGLSCIDINKIPINGENLEVKLTKGSNNESE